MVCFFPWWPPSDLPFLRAFTLEHLPIYKFFLCSFEMKTARLLPVFPLKNVFLKNLGDTLWNVIIKEDSPLSPSLCGIVGIQLGKHQLPNADGLNHTNHRLTPPGALLYFIYKLTQQLKPLLPFVSKELSSPLSPNAIVFPLYCNCCK